MKIKIRVLSAFFFISSLLITGLAYAAAPTVGTISPSSGTTAPDIAKTFTCKYYDTDGWTNLKEAYLLISRSSTNLSNSVYLYYDQNTNLLYVRNDADTSWLGGYAPGSDYVIENSSVRLNYASSVVTGSGNTLTVKWNITFKPTYSGKAYNSYLKIVDDTGGFADWTKKGTHKVNYTPSLGTIIPSSGTSQIDESVNFITTYLDQDGWQNIQQAVFLMNTSISGSNCLYVYYNQNTNKLYLRNDANSSWRGGYTPGSNKIIENSYVRLNCVLTTVSGSADTLTINWNVTFKSAFTGTKNAYLYVRDDVNATAGWIQVGTWSIQTDIVPPTGSIKVNNDSAYTNSISVTLSLWAEDNSGGSGLSQMQFSNDNSNWSAPEAYATTKSWTLTEGDGTKTVYVKYKDVVGNWSEPFLDSIILDTTPPVIIITAPQNGAVVQEPQVELEWTVDAEPFSDTITLASEGENILTKTAIDAAGNTSSASITVYYYPGELIGPEGGEVNSSDGMVKVIIPAGALAQPTQINVLKVDKDTLGDATPSGTALLSVVDCRPYGLVFNQPVSIIYTLYQAEIPGTPVELGFYDAVQNEIIPTGQTTTVPVDGYTVSFSVMHFSTYAALKNLTPQGAPVGAGVKIPLPDMLTGAFSHSIPITIPPGRKGIQPALAFHYRSSNPNSWAGLGFSLNPGYIVRSTRLGPPSYIDTQDTFYLITDAGTAELVNLIDNLYQAKVESGFAKFFKEPDDSWKVVAKEGSVLKFGSTPDSKETSGQGTFAWYLTKAIDTNGNYIEYHYIKDQGKSYLSFIGYTGNEMGIAPTNSVEFFLESRDDVTSNYISSSRIVTAKRLKEIQVKVGYDLVWRYSLEYNYSLDTNRSLLKSVTQYASDNKSLPQQKFSYQGAK